MSKYQTVNLPRDLAERIAKVCMFTMFAEDGRQLRAILARPAEQHQGEPVAHNLADKVREALDRQACPNAWMVIAYEAVIQNFTHADPNVRWEAVAGEQMRVIEQLRADVARLDKANLDVSLERKAALEGWDKSMDECDALLAQLAERDALLREVRDSCALWMDDHQPTAATMTLDERIEAALSASAKPNAQRITMPNADCAICRHLGDECMTCEEQRNSSAPVERDERAAFEVESLRNNRPVDRLPSGDYLLPATRFAWQGWQARAALECNPSVLVNQLQADLTERDERIDMLEKQVQLADHWLEFASFNNVGEPVEHTQEMRDEFRKQMIAAVFPDYVAASTDGRLNGIPKKPCSGCGTPGWTGACTKCVPY